MRFPVLERFKFKYVTLFAVCLFFAQVAEGTDLTFALLTFVYILLFALGFNAAGGFIYPSGAWIFFTGTLTCIVGLTYKVLLNEPGQSHLHNPLITMGAYCVAMAGTALAAYICRIIRPRRGLLAGMAGGEKMKQAAIGCFLFGFVGFILSASSIGDSATVGTAFAQLNHFGQLALILGTTYQIVHSKGKSSTNWIVWGAGLAYFTLGLLSYSKEGMFTSAFAWLVPCIVMRFNFSRNQLIGAIIIAFLGIYYLVPLSQYGRRSRGESESLSGQFVILTYYLTHLTETRQNYIETADAADVGDDLRLFDKSQGIFDRMQMLAFDDALIEYTETNQTIGFSPTANSFLNTIPRFIWKNKPTFAQGNLYGRELGIINEDDTTTGISFSPVGDAYNQGAWFGVGFVLPLLMLMLFLVADSLSGDVRKSPWGLLFIAISAHSAPEGMLVGVVWMATFGAEIIIFSALVSSYILPRIVTLITGGEKTRVQVTRDFVLGNRTRRSSPLRPSPDPNSPAV